MTMESICLESDHIVELRWDDEACVWYAACDSVPIAMESGSFDALIERVKAAVPEILELNGMPFVSYRLIFRAERMEQIANGNL